jgi:hypothetical protein
MVDAACNHSPKEILNSDDHFDRCFAPSAIEAKQPNQTKEQK